MGPHLNPVPGLVPQKMLLSKLILLLGIVPAVLGSDAIQCLNKVYDADEDGETSASDLESEDCSNDEAVKCYEVTVEVSGVDTYFGGCVDPDNTCDEELEALQAIASTASSTLDDDSLECAVPDSPAVQVSALLASIIALMFVFA